MLDNPIDQQLQAAEWNTALLSLWCGKNIEILWLYFQWHQSLLRWWWESCYPRQCLSICWVEAFGSKCYYPWPFTNSFTSSMQCRSLCYSYFVSFLLFLLFMKYILFPQEKKVSGFMYHNYVDIYRFMLRWILQYGVIIFFPIECTESVDNWIKSLPKTYLKNIKSFNIYWAFPPPINTTGVSQLHHQPFWCTATLS